MPMSSDKFRMSPCALDYMKALHNPFDLQVEPCIPTITALPSHKMRVMTRGTFRVGTTGYGGIALWPMRLLTRDTGLTPAGTTAFPAIVATNETFDTTDFWFTNLSTVAVAETRLNYYAGATSAYTLSQLGNSGGTLVPSNRTAKLVAAGIRVQYVDKVLDCSGDYIAWRNPAPRYSLTADQDTVTQLLAQNNAVQGRIDGDWAGVTYHPVREDDYQGRLDPAYWMAAGGVAAEDISQRLACGLFIANAQQGARFAFEVVGFFEVAGPAISTTQSHSDPVALGLINSAERLTSTLNLREEERNAQRSLLRSAASLGYSGITALTSTEGLNRVGAAVSLLSGMHALGRQMRH